MKKILTFITVVSALFLVTACEDVDVPIVEPENPVEKFSMIEVMGGLGSHDNIHGNVEHLHIAPSYLIVDIIEYLDEAKTVRDDRHMYTYDDENRVTNIMVIASGGIMKSDENIDYDMANIARSYKDYPYDGQIDLMASYYVAPEGDVSAITLNDGHDNFSQVSQAVTRLDFEADTMTQVNTGENPYTKTYTGNYANRSIVFTHDIGSNGTDDIRVYREYDEKFRLIREEEDMNGDYTYERVNTFEYGDDPMWNRGHDKLVRVMSSVHGGEAWISESYSYDRDDLNLTRYLKDIDGDRRFEVGRELTYDENTYHETVVSEIRASGAFGVFERIHTYEYEVKKP